jgi:hypothetical protein
VLGSSKPKPQRTPQTKTLFQIIGYLLSRHPSLQAPEKLAQATKVDPKTIATYWDDISEALDKADNE